MCFSDTVFGDRILLQYCLYHRVKKNITFQMMYNMWFYLKYSGSNKRKAKTALDDCKCGLFHFNVLLPFV